jgi:hypothetical protein
MCWAGLARIACGARVHLQRHAVIASVPFEWSARLSVVGRPLRRYVVGVDDDRLAEVVDAVW